MAEYTQHSEAAEGEPPMQEHESEAAGPKVTKMHDVALSAEKNLEQLATMLAQSKADQGAIKAVTQMADAMRQIVKAMATKAEAAPPPEQKHTMASATDSMAADLRSNRQ